MRDRLGRIRIKIETIEGVTTTTEYTYDLAGRLDTVTVDGQLVRDYDYDPNGNRLRELPGGPVIASYDAQDRLLSRGTVTYAYNEHGDLETRTDTATSETTTYAYALLGNLTAVDLPDGRQITYVIDGAGRRVGKRVDGVLTRGWLYADALNPVAELDDAGNVVSRFIYGSRAHVPDAMIQNGTVYAIVSDRLGSVGLVVDTATGDVMQRLDYDEWGNVTKDTNAGFQPFGFAGGLYDPDTSLVRFGARDYDAVAGRWSSKDPLRFDSTGTNLYGYVVNDPVNRIDRTGLIPGALGEPPLREFCEQMIPPKCPGDESDVRERRIQACITEAALAGADAATNVGGSPPSTAVNIIQKIVESLPRSVQRRVRRLAE